MLDVSWKRRSKELGRGGERKEGGEGKRKEEVKELEERGGNLKIF